MSSKGEKGSLILEEFNFKKDENEFIKIKGRVSGFRNWVLSFFEKASTGAGSAEVSFPKLVLTIFGRPSKISFICNKQALIYEESKTKYNIPLAKIACVSSGFKKKKPLLLVLGIIFIIFGLAFPEYIRYVADFSVFKTVVVITGIVLLIFYILRKKTIHFGIYIGENDPIITITMGKGIIGSITAEEFELVAATLNEAVLANVKAK